MCSNLFFRFVNISFFWHCFFFFLTCLCVCKAFVLNKSLSSASLNQAPVPGYRHSSCVLIIHMCVCLCARVRKTWLLQEKFGTNNRESCLIEPLVVTLIPHLVSLMPHLVTLMPHLVTLIPHVATLTTHLVTLIPHLVTLMPRCVRCVTVCPCPRPDPAHVGAAHFSFLVCMYRLLDWG